MQFATSMMLSVTLLVLGVVKFSCTEQVVSSSVSSTNSGSGNESVMYSYSEAVVGNDGKPKVSQLIITKEDGDSQYHYYNGSSNGTVETGKWSGPIPSFPELSALNVFDNKVNKTSGVYNSTKNVVDRLGTLSESIANSFQDYIKNVLIP